MSDRINKVLAHAGLGSRRQCEELVLAGRVRIDGEVVRELATQVDLSESEVVVDGKTLKLERPVYWLVHKPRGVLCTNYDPEGRPRAIDLVPHIKQRVYTVGRLDEESEGLLLLTNDGDLAHRLMHPRFGVDKTYLVQVAGSPTGEDLQKLLDGFWLSDGRARARKVERLRKQGDSTWLRIVLNEGKNREIRRMLAKLDHKVLCLRRVAIGPIQLGHLARGKSRELHGQDIETLQRISDPERRAPRRDPREKKVERRTDDDQRESSNDKRQRLKKSRDTNKRAEQGRNDTRRGDNRRSDNRTDSRREDTRRGEGQRSENRRGDQQGSGGTSRRSGTVKKKSNRLHHRVNKRMRPS